MLLLYMLLCIYFPANVITAGSLIDDVYEDLKVFFVNCTHLFPVCENQLSNSLTTFGCHCDVLCSQSDTCCINSPYRHLEPSTPKETCGQYEADVQDSGTGEFIIEKCPAHTTADNIFRDNCEKERSEFKDDLKLFIPVTSFFTNVTYKNYFCFRCYEEHEDYLYWHARFSRYTKYEDNCNDVVPICNSMEKAWMAPLGKNGDFIPVDMKLEIPLKIKETVKHCVPKLISNCSSQWEDEKVRQKCSAYTSIIRYPAKQTKLPPFPKTYSDFTTVYKNPHCALCNFERLDIFLCFTGKITFGQGGESFTKLLDMNGNLGNRVGHIERCPENEVWDDAFQKCKTVTCAREEHVWKDGKCSIP